MLQVYQNLIENAIKYAKPDQHIGSKTENKLTVYFIKYDGIGINSEFQDRIFDVFEKLNENTEGSGIGLAIVNRIITNQGRKIWIESQGDDTGTTFCFSLPNKP